MSWRVVVISNRCKLDYSMNYIVIRGEETKRILLDEIALLMIENNAVSMTGCLLSALLDKKIKVIMCDAKHNPEAELVPYYGSHNDSLRIKQQIGWSKESKEHIWTRIVREKIHNQAVHLNKLGCKSEALLLEDYIKELEPGDVTNREGHAAKVYFNAVFGMDFARSDDRNVINHALNYGYSILLSAFNREVVSNGYLTQIGLEHDNQFNHFNLSCDLMEPFRILVDIKVRQMGIVEFTKEEKYKLVDILNDPYVIQEKKQTMLNAIRIYTKSVFDAINDENESLIKFVEI